MVGRRRGDDDAASGEVQWLDDGPDEVLGGAEPRPRRRWPRWWPMLLVAVVAAIVIVAVTNRGKPTASPPPGPASTLPPGPAVPRLRSPVRSAVQVTDVGHPLLGVTAGWDLFIRGQGVVVRIQPALGRVTSTTVPALDSTGPVFFVAMSGQAIVRPLDFVPSYAVPDGRPARQLAGRLDQGGPVLPGPDPEHVWVPSGSNVHPKMVLVDGHGRPGVSIAIPADMNGFPEPDGGGYVLLTVAGGVFDARPDGLHRITTGEVLAAGPTGWLARECDIRHRCRSVMIDRTTGARHVLKDLPDFDGASGVISPDGATAALVAPGAVHLVDLASGAERRGLVTVDGSLADEEAVVWSPDSRWLFAPDTDGRLAVIDARTGHVGRLGVSLPAPLQLEVRR